MNAYYPTSEKDELCIIGCCLDGGLDTAIEAVESVPIEAFSSASLREAFGLIEQLATAGKQVNTYTLQTQWSEQNKGVLPEEIIRSTDAIASSGNLKYHIDAIVELWRKRRVMEAARDLLESGKNPLVTYDQMLGNIERALSGEELRGTETLDGKQCSRRLIDDLERRYQLQGRLSGVPSGFTQLDYLTDGFQFGEQTILGARPGMGKSALGIGLVLHACCKCKIPTLFVSMEMSVEALMRRMCSAWTEIKMSDLRKGSYSAEQFEEFKAFMRFISICPLWIADAVSGLGVNQLCALVRRRCRKNGVRLVIIDYLQKLSPSERHEKRTYEIGAVSQAVRALSVSTGAAFITLAQLNRDSEKDKKPRAPRLSDLADSKQIEQDADTICLIDRRRSEGDISPAWLVVAKQRDGRTGAVELQFNGTYARFENP